MDISQPRWKAPEYSKKDINRAGNIIRSVSASLNERKAALKVVDNWRAAHAYPLHVFYMNLRGKANSRNDVLVAERLKRMESIVVKLQREEKMQLYRMQDLGGCRMVLPTLQEVYTYSERFQKSRIRHELIKINDYIQNPKETGYRSLHYIYRFKSDTPDKEIYNRYPMLIELQFRTHLQHIWATALETIGLFTSQALKAGQGNKEILRFFAIVSSLFAIQEECPIVPWTVADEKELISEIEVLNNQYHILDMLKAIRVVIIHDSDTIPDKKGYFILQLDYQKHTLRRKFFKPSELEAANKQYDALEAANVGKPLDIVLVRAASYSTVRDAYPNYFLDIGEFIGIVQGYLNPK